MVATVFAQGVKSDPAARLDRENAAPVAEMNHFFPLNPDGGVDITSAPDDYDVPSMTEHGPLGLAQAAFQHTILAANLTYHGGDVINTAKLVCIFWGPTWASGGSDHTNATTIQAFRNQLGTSSHYSMLTQYYDSAYINTTNLAGSQPDWFDTTNALPSTGNVTDSVVQSEVKRYVSANGYNGSTIYEVFLPKYVPGTTKLVYSSDGSSTSCGGPGLAYCAYHSHYSSTSGNVKYSIEPYPSCSGCQVSGWTSVQNMTHFMVHETREAVTDALGNAWYDSSGYEADDKCAWTGLFLSNGYGYQPEWSNAAGGCVQ
ncbi:MAG TPA: hypothetical protein VGJ82_22605 [Thermoanaerobaculia bacterium]